MPAPASAALAGRPAIGLALRPRRLALHVRSLVVHARRLAHLPLHAAAAVE